MAANKSSDYLEKVGAFSFLLLFREALHGAWSEQKKAPAFLPGQG